MVQQLFFFFASFSSGPFFFHRGIKNSVWKYRFGESILSPVLLSIKKAFIVINKNMRSPFRCLASCLVEQFWRLRGEGKQNLIFNDVEGASFES